MILLDFLAFPTVGIGEIFFLSFLHVKQKCKAVVDFDSEERGLIPGSITYDLWPLLSHCSLTYKIGIIIVVITFIIIDLLVEPSTAGGLNEIMHVKALVN